MKIAGQVIAGPQPEVVVIPRGENDFVFKAQPVLDFNDFEKLCPMPTPPEKMYPGGEKVLNPEDPKYKKALDEWAAHKTDWMILKSLEATEGIEWETVDKSDYKTWHNYTDELEQSFTPLEISKIVNAVINACGLNQDRIDEATKRFLATQKQG